MLISKELIQLDANYKTKEEVIENIAKLFESKGKLNDLSGYIQAVKMREAEVSTNMGDRIGMPHARTNTVNEAGLAFVRLRKPIKWDDNGEVQIVFQIAVPESGGDLHLQILSKLARKLIYEEFKQQLFEVHSEEELLSLIQAATGGLV